MSNDFTIEIITPTRQMDMGTATYLRLPGMNGLFGVMKNHTTVLISLGVGEIKIENSGDNEYLATSGGVLDFKNNKAQLLLETVEKADDINQSRAEESKSRAKDRLKGDRVDRLRSEISIARALNRLNVAKRS
jgi:F-type H+-transporting ATPase subunit epsilon